MIRKYIAFLIVVCIVCANAFSACAEHVFYIACSKSSYIYVREYADEESKVIATLDRGAEVISELGWMQDGWLVVTVNGKPGWIKWTFASIEPPFENKKAVIVSDNKKPIMIRNMPEGKLKFKAKNGTQVNVLSVLKYGDDLWYRIDTGENRGWVIETFLKVEEN